MQAVLVEPVDPAQSGELEVVHAAPRPLVAYALCLVEPNQALGLGVVPSQRSSGSAPSTEEHGQARVV